MANSLLTLVKITKKEIDSLLLEKKDIQKKIEDCENFLKELQKKILEEKQKHTSSEYAYFLEPFLKASVSQENQVKFLLEKLNAELDKIEEKIREAFAEQKRFEIIIKKKKLEEVKKSQEKETKFLDELNIIRKKELI